ncbi:hypothetical protein BGZ60DRAFT_384495 [Tricladium varicosporioides]|nr:hypothetical protein BGZ60DRAFT_384495 [Hymenoscyphus varicosporioides]
MVSNEDTITQRKRKDLHTEGFGNPSSILEKNPAYVVEENKRLKLELQKVATENEILRATSAPSYRGTSGTRLDLHPPSDFYTEVPRDDRNEEPGHMIGLGEREERLLNAGSTWDYITDHPLYKKGLVNVGEVSERLKKVSKADGQSIVWEEREIIKAIVESVTDGTDEFI